MARYIDADAMIEGSGLLNMPAIGKDWDNYGFLSLIRKQPTADVRPVVRGRWIEHEDPNGDPYYECSACHGEMVCIDGTPLDNDFLFCNFCGADMREEEQNG